MGREKSGREKGGRSSSLQITADQCLATDNAIAMGAGVTWGSLGVASWQGSGLSVYSDPQQQKQKLWGEGGRRMIIIIIIIKAHTH